MSALASLAQRSVESSGDAMLCVDLDGVVLTWNPAAESLYGLTSREAIGTALHDLAAGGAGTALCRAHAAAAAGERVERFDSWHHHRDGTPRAVAVNARRLPDATGQVEAVLITVRDDTARRVLAQELDHTRIQLERNNEALRRSNRDLEQFAYVASHDLSEPLRVVTSYVSQLERRFDGQLDDRGARYLHHIVDGCTRMRALIDDLLQYARFLHEPPSDETVDLHAVLEAVRSELAEAIAESGAQVKTADLPSVRGDARQVHSLLQNLLSNAIKFRRGEEPPQVLVSGTESAGWVTVVVDDNGIGIAPEYRERVFRMFQRLHVREAYPGTGIGLALAQRVVETAGGTIRADESPQGGTRMCFTLPAVNGAAR